MELFVKNRKFLIALAALAVTTIFCSVGADEEAANVPLIATVSEIEGTVQTLKPEDGLFINTSSGQLLSVNDQLLTHQDARARLDLSNGTIVRVGPLSHFTLLNMEQNADGPFTRLKLEIGELFIILNGGSVDVDTPSGLASVRGSYMNVRVIPNTYQTIITCLEGFCQVENGAGELNITAGQKAYISDYDTLPTPDKMSDEDVSHWLQYNPEATTVVVPLTATRPASEDKTPTATGTLNPDDTCPTPVDWTAITVAEGDTITSLAGVYGITAQELAAANCIKATDALEPGKIIFVPAAGDAATSTATPTASATGQLDSTSTVLPSATASTGSATNAEFVNPSGPVDVIGECDNLYSVEVFDPDGVDYVKVEYSVNDPTFANSTFSRLFDKGGGLYKDFLLIKTFENVGTDTVYWRFVAVDILGNLQWFPVRGAAAISFEDSNNCGGSPIINTTITNIVAPADGSLIISCANEFSVKVTDPDGLQFVKVEYSVNDPSFSGTTYIQLTQSGDTWSGLVTIPTSSTAGKDTVYWRFWIIDGLGNYIYYPADTSLTYLDDLEC